MDRYSNRVQTVARGAEIVGAEVPVPVEGELGALVAKLGCRSYAGTLPDLDGGVDLTVHVLLRAPS